MAVPLFSITIPATSSAVDAVTGKQFTFYYVCFKSGEFQHKCQRRFNNFLSFHQEWAKVYPLLEQSHKLEENKTLFNKSAAVIERRRLYLQNYLQSISTISCLQPFVAQFIGIELRYITGEKASDKPAISATLETQALIVDSGVRKGNNDEAANRALEEKKAFLEKHRELLAQLMPGHDVKLSEAVSSLHTIEKKEEKAPEKPKAQNVVMQDVAEVMEAYTPDPTVADRCLALKQGDLVLILDKGDGEWWYGELKNDPSRRGYFPSTFVKVVHEHAVSVVEINDFGEDEESLRLASQVPSMKLSFEDQLKLMVAGETFIKYTYGNGFPAKRDVFYRPLADASSNLGCLFWGDVGKRDLDGKRCIAVAQITDVFIGKHTKAFEKRLAKEALDNRCFSIRVGEVRTLDLEAVDKERRDAWVLTLNHLLAGKERTVRLSRFMAPVGLQQQNQQNQQSQRPKESLKVNTVIGATVITSSGGSSAGGPRQPTVTHQRSGSQPNLRLEAVDKSGASSVSGYISGGTPGGGRANALPATSDDKPPPVPERTYLSKKKVSDDVGNPSPVPSPRGGPKPPASPLNNPAGPSPPVRAGLPHSSSSSSTVGGGGGGGSLQPSIYPTAPNPLAVPANSVLLKPANGPRPPPRGPTSPTNSSSSSSSSMDALPASIASAPEGPRPPPKPRAPPR